MDSAGMVVLLRWAKECNTDPLVRTCLTFAMVLDSTSELSSYARRMPQGWMDEELLSTILVMAEPCEIARLLGWNIGRDLSPEFYQRVFERAISATSDAETIAYLMIDAANYLNKNLGAFALPMHIAELLMESVQCDHRIAGLRAFRHTGAAPSELARRILQSLGSSSWDERWNALSLLCRVFEDRKPDLLSELSPADASAITAALQIHSAHEIREDGDPDWDARRAAMECIRKLQSR